MNFLRRVNVWVGDYTVRTFEGAWGKDKGASPEAYARYYRDFRIAVVAYIGLTIVAGRTLHFAQNDFQRGLILLVPAAAIVALGITTVRFVLQWDELQRRICVETTAVAGAALLFLLYPLTALENAGLFAIPPHVVLIALLVLWAIAYPFVRHRYE